MDALENQRQRAKKSSQWLAKQYLKKQVEPNGPNLEMMDTKEAAYDLSIDSARNGANMMIIGSNLR